MKCKVCGNKEFQELEFVGGPVKLGGWDYIDIYYCKKCGTLRVDSWSIEDNN